MGLADWLDPQRTKAEEPGVAGPIERHVATWSALVGGAWLIFVIAAFIPHDVQLLLMAGFVTWTARQESKRVVSG